MLAWGLQQLFLFIKRSDKCRQDTCCIFPERTLTEYCLFCLNQQSKPPKSFFATLCKDKQQIYTTEKLKRIFLYLKNDLNIYLNQNNTFPAGSRKYWLIISVVVRFLLKKVEWLLCCVYVVNPVTNSKPVFLTNTWRKNNFSKSEI